MKKIIKSNSLATRYPDLAQQWHPTKNGGLTPYNVTAGSNKKVWWKCKRGHEWERPIPGRVYGYHDCPICKKEDSRKQKAGIRKKPSAKLSGCLTLTSGNNHKIKYDLSSKEYTFFINNKKRFSDRYFSNVHKYVLKNGLDRKTLPNGQADSYDWK